MNRRTTRRPAPAAVCLLALLALSPLAALEIDGGLNLGNSLTARPSGELSDWQNELKLAPWGSLYQDAGGGGYLELIGQASFMNTLKRPYVFDLDQLRLTSVSPRPFGEGSVIELNAGRFRFADPTGLILSHVADGLRLGLLFSGWQIRLAGAYSGLIVNPNSDIRVSADDWGEVDNDVSYFGPRRLIGQLDFAFQDFLWYQNFNLQLLGQYDLRDKSTAEIVHTAFLIFSGSSRLNAWFYLDSFLGLSPGWSTLGSKKTMLLSALGGLSLKYFNEDLAAMRAHLSATYGSGFVPLVLLGYKFGDYVLSIEDFRPINQPETGLAFAPRLGNLMYADFGWSFRPFSRSSSTVLSGLQPGLGARAYFRSWTSDILAKDIDPTATGLYLGTEVELSLAARLFSDLGLSIRAAGFYPGSGGFGIFKSSRKPDYALKVELSAGL